MAWTYSGDPSASSLDAVRFLLGDTDSTDPQLQDAEIEWMLSENQGTYITAAHLCQTLAAKYARLADKSVGDLSISYSQRQDHYLKMMAKLERLASLHDNAAPAYCGGISLSDKETDETDTDRVKPAFSVGMMNNNCPIDQTNDQGDV